MAFTVKESDSNNWADCARSRGFRFSSKCGLPLLMKELALTLIFLSPTKDTSKSLDSPVSSIS